jgi:hypothetical protein
VRSKYGFRKLGISLKRCRSAFGSAIPLRHPQWIGPDAKDMMLIFSGVKLPDITYDAFCVRHMKLELSF